MRAMELLARAELESIAFDAGNLALRHFRHVASERKADRTLVTAADREVEAFLVAALRSRLPEAGILGEEGTVHDGRGSYRIVLDPIDGTAAFVAGLPTWCICIGILRGDEPVAGVVHMPCAGETYSAVGGEAWWNGARLPVLTGDAASAGDRFIVAHAKAHLRHRIRYPGKVRSLGSSAYHAALVARGVAEVAILGHVHLWDVAAVGAVLQAVGGCFVYLDTGAAKRVGRATALELAACGMNVVVHYHTSAEEAAATVRELGVLGVRACALAADLGRTSDVARLAADAERHSGGLTVLVNNASNYLRVPFEQLTEAAWDASLDTNLKAPFLLAWHIGRGMRARGGGHIVNLADWAGERPYRDYLPYCVSKAGMIGLTRALAKELAPEVQVIEVAPVPGVPRGVRPAAQR